MSVFQIFKNSVLIIDGEKQYSDTVDNFLLDAGAVSVPESVIYDDAQECCVVDGDFLSYPNSTYSGYCDRIQDLLDAQAKRTYVPPAELTEQERQEDQKAGLKADYDSAVKELSNSMAVASTALTSWWTENASTRPASLISRTSKPMKRRKVSLNDNKSNRTQRRWGRQSGNLYG